MNKRLAAIDIGSNAIRMVISEYTPQGFQFIKKFRLPIRLGSDVFEKGKISAKNLKEAARTFERFKKLTEEFRVDKIRAVGTSALREAKNQSAFVELMRRKSLIRVEIIDGVEEARLIHLAVKKEVYLENHCCLLIDIGGGSVELSFSERGLMSATESFPLGTVRLLEQMKQKKLSESQINLALGPHVNSLSQFIKSHSSEENIDFAIGTGGNLETMGKLKPLLLRRDSRNVLSFQELQEMVQKLSKMTLKERIEKLDLRPDRADVILPASHLLLSVMTLASVEKLLIPYVGLKDGVLWSMVNGNGGGSFTPSARAP